MRSNVMATGQFSPAAASSDKTEERVVASLVQLRAWLASQNATPGTRLPPERELAEVLGVSRGNLRKALAVLEAEGEIWRHVGKGTFLGARRHKIEHLAEIHRDTNPAEVMRVRLLFEPMIAGEAALNANANHIQDLRLTAKLGERAATWRQYEASDNQLHRQIAEATGNMLLLAFFDAMNEIRRMVVWSRVRSDHGCPPPDHHSFAEHRRIIEAIAGRDRDGADAAMRDHLRRVSDELLGP